MLQRLLGPAERFAQEREVVVAVGEARVLVQRPLVCIHRGALAAHVLEQDAQVVEQQRLVAAGEDRAAINALRFREAARLVQQPSKVDVSSRVRRVRLQRSLVDLPGGCAVAPFQVASALEPVFGARRRVGLAVLDHTERSGRRIAFEVENVLPGVRLPAAQAVLDDDAIGQRFDGQARKGHCLGEVAAKLLQRTGDAPRRYFRGGESLRGAQHDQIAKREEPGLARAALRRYVPRVDQALYGAARKVKQSLDVADAVRVRCGRIGGGDYFFAAFLGASCSACWARLGALRSSGVAAFTGAGAFFLSRLARSASIRSMTSAPPSGASAMVISWPSTFFCTAASTRARTSSV